MKHRLSNGQQTCPSCGGELIRKSPDTFQCTSCQREYYQSVNKSHKISIHLSIGKMILICAAVVIGVTAAAVAGYQYYTGSLVQSARRFSVAFRDFLMEAYEKPVAEIREEELAKIRYLKIEKEKGYCFTYSFEDYYDYGDMAHFQNTLHTITVEADRDDFSPTNVQYFTGLTRLELYTGAWENYELPEENVLRGIFCTDGLSKYGIPKFFTRVNPDTLEEVMILEADKLTDFSFMEDLTGVKKFSLEGAVLNNVAMFQGFDQLEELSLYAVTMEEEKTFELIENLLSIPSLTYFYIEGKTGWYLTDEQWAELEQQYGERVTLIRK